MSTSVTLSIGTNTAIAAAKGFGWFVTGSPTLFAETIHSIADVANQVLLRTGEVRSKMLADSKHPFGYGQEKYFWALVSAVACSSSAAAQSLPRHPCADPARAGRAVHAAGARAIAFACVLESFTLVVALREIGG
jgi:hypothetical protein